MAQAENNAHDATSLIICFEGALSAVTPTSFSADRMNSAQRTKTRGVSLTSNPGTRSKGGSRRKEYRFVSRNFNKAHVVSKTNVHEKISVRPDIQFTDSLVIGC